jgi:hypothetical protein
MILCPKRACLTLEESIKDCLDIKFEFIIVVFFKVESDVDGLPASVSIDTMSSIFKLGEGLVPLKNRLSTVI